MPHTAESPAAPRESYETPHGVRLALARMDLTPTQMAALMRYWASDRKRPRGTVARGVMKFASRRRTIPTPWMLQVILHLMECSPERWKADLPRATEEWENADDDEGAAAGLQYRRGEKLAHAVERAREGNTERANRFAAKFGPIALELLQSGLTLSGVAEELTKRNVPTPSGQQQQWSDRTVQSLLARAQRVLEQRDAAKPDQDAA